MNERLNPEAETRTEMNTKASFTVGWIAYTAAFAIGGAIAIHRYWNGPGGRREREEAADRLRAEQAAREAVEEERIRRERAAAKLRAARDITAKMSQETAH